MPSLNFTVFNGTSVQDMFTYPNSITGDLWGSLIIVGIFMISFLTLKNAYTTDRSILTASYLTVILAFTLFVASVVNQEVLGIVIVIFLVSVAAFFFFRPSQGA